MEAETTVAPLTSAKLGASRKSRHESTNVATNTAPFVWKAVSRLAAIISLSTCAVLAPVSTSSTRMEAERSTVAAAGVVGLALAGAAEGLGLRDGGGAGTEAEAEA